MKGSRREEEEKSDNATIPVEPLLFFGKRNCHEEGEGSSEPRRIGALGPEAAGFKSKSCCLPAT